MFGPDARLAVNREPAPLPNEETLVAELRAKLGPGPDLDRIVFSIRSARGKTHWAVNSYLRDVMSTGCAPGEEDFHPGRVGRGGQVGETNAVHVVGMPLDLTSVLAAPAGSISLDALPSSILELIMRNLDYISLCAAAMTCKALAAVAASDVLWSGLFSSRWGSVVFPTEAHLAVGTGLGPDGVRGHGSGPGGRAVTGVGPGVPGLASSLASNRGLGPGMALAGLALADVVGSTAVAGEPVPSSRGSDNLRRSALSLLGSGLAPVREDDRLPSHQHQPLQPQQLSLTSAATLRAACGQGGDLQQGSASAEASTSVLQCKTTTGSSQLASGVAVPGVPATSEPRAGTVEGSSSRNGSSSARQRYRHQLAFLKSLRCPRCGGAVLLPILYGFPSAKLLEGMRLKRLILGGDHLIESCHVWGCPNDRCGASYRYFPYDAVDEWMSDLATQPAEPHYTYEL